MIRPAMQVWFDSTKKLIESTRVSSEEQREEAIVSIGQRLDERDKLQAHIVAPFTPEEEVFGKELIALETEMQKSLALFSKQIRGDISDSQSKKDNMKSYVNPYSSVARDGAYYDTKQ